MGKSKPTGNSYLSLNGTCFALITNVDHVLTTIINYGALAYLFLIALRSDCSITDRILQCTGLADRIFPVDSELLKLLTISYNALNRTNPPLISLTIAKLSAANIALVVEVTG